MHWQYEMINEMFKEYGSKAKDISYVTSESIENQKRKYIRSSIRKFYAPSIENISDVANQLLWLADPGLFNDPDDCKLRIDESFEIYVLNKIIENDPDFTPQEKSIIWGAVRHRNSIYSPQVYQLLQGNKGFNYFYEQISELKNRAGLHVNNLNHTKYRIACFVENSYEPYEYDNLMWAHYAQNYRGFCVEYDIDKVFSAKYKDFYSSYFDSKAKSFCGLIDAQSIKNALINGFFPVIYTSHKKPTIPAATAYKIACGNCTGKYFDNVENSFVRALITKDLIWKYEREWRLIINDSLISTIGYKIPFPFATKIIVGVTASKELKLLLKNICDKLNIDFVGQAPNIKYT